MLKEQYTGQGKVVLLAGGGRIYTDIAARFVRSERSLEEIVATPYSKKIVENILNSGHGAALEFDFFLFGVAGFALAHAVFIVYAAQSFRFSLPALLVALALAVLYAFYLKARVFPQADGFLLDEVAQDGVVGVHHGAGDHGDGLGAAGAQGAGDVVADIAHVAGDLLDMQAGFAADVVLVFQRAGDRVDGEAGGFRDVLQGDGLIRIPAQVQAPPDGRAR